MHCTGLRIQRMPSEAGQEFGDPASYPYMTVASPSCHDTSTTRAWWEEDAGRRERFYDQARSCNCPDRSQPVHQAFHWLSLSTRVAEVVCCAQQCFAMQCSAVHCQMILV